MVTYSNEMFLSKATVLTFIKVQNIQTHLLLFDGETRLHVTFLHNYCLNIYHNTCKIFSIVGIETKSLKIVEFQSMIIK